MEFGCTPGDLYAGYIVEDSDLEFSDCSGEESSGEDGEEMGHCKSAQHGPSGDSDDEFSREMDKELLSKIQFSVSPSVAQATNITRMCEVIAKPKEEPAMSTGSPKPKSIIVQPQNSHEVYDELCFDSSESEGEDDQAGSTRYVGKKVSKLSNDELFYDPGLDDEDERWVNRQRMAYYNVKVSRSLEKQKKSKRAWSKPANTGEHVGSEHKTEDNETVKDAAAQDLESRLSKSDAVLNCPACMTTLCLDCQRHDQYVSQYRAMFVLNCVIVKEETLTYNPKSGKKGQKRRRGKDKGNVTEEQSAYHPVKCHECNTEVAVYDHDEVFHFFNVLASAP